MQEKKSHMVKYVLDTLADYAEVKGIRGLADFICETHGRLYGWIRNGRIVDTGSILTKFPEINKKWLETGEGPMLKEQDGDRYNGPSTQIITGKNSILAGRSITGGKNTVVLNDSDQLPGDALVLDADELELILLSREVGGKMMLRKFIGELEQLKKLIERQI